MFFVILLVAYFGRHLVLLFLALGAVQWLTMSRIVRGQMLQLRGQEFVVAIVALGASHKRIILRHLLPNILAPIVVIANVRFAWVIILEASLSFLGAGVPAEQPSLGRLILNGYQMLFSGYWWISVLPGAALMLLVLGVNLLGDWLREALNPKLAT